MTCQWPVDCKDTIPSNAWRTEAGVACSSACLRTTGNFPLLMMRLELHRATMEENLAFNGPFTYNTNHDTQYNFTGNADRKRSVYEKYDFL